MTTSELKSLIALSSDKEIRKITAEILKLESGNDHHFTDTLQCELDLSFHTDLDLVQRTKMISYIKEDVIKRFCTK